MVLPLDFLAALALMVATYLALVELGKHVFFSRLGAAVRPAPSNVRGESGACIAAPPGGASDGTLPPKARESSTLACARYSALSGLIGRPPRASANPIGSGVRWVLGDEPAQQRVELSLLVHRQGREEVAFALVE